MELNKNKRWIYLLTGLLLFLILTLGVWWLYLVLNLSATLHQLNLDEVGGHQRLVNIVKWEGLTFFILLSSVALTLFYLFFQENKKTNALHHFFASLTHELKTPLTSIRLQSEVIQEFKFEDPKLKKITTRLVQDSQKLESELENSLQLSRVLRGGTFELHPLNLQEYLVNLIKRTPELNFELDCPQDINIMVDEHALNTIMRNLIQNTRRHRKLDKPVLIMIQPDTKNNTVQLIYNDRGEAFTGARKKLSELYYKHNSNKGTGIGLFLIKNLMNKLQGKFEILNTENLVFSLTFKREAL
ncbi:MAG: HAMP domain-containing histidine kinase [Bacteriovoracaceae bacterium]|nr:HAMP domain-containing histidine kinase [Bacteriovoracaceae bacterium]